MTSRERIPRIVIAAHKGGAGKTLLSVGIVAALRKRGLSVAAFKKGPDYIDAGWLGLAAGGDCYNLDAYLFPRAAVRHSFVKRSLGKDLAVIEGNRGLFDGVDAEGSYSTAELAKLVAAPIVLVVDATKMTRTAAALVVGCRILDPDLDLQGVIFNRVAGARHEGILRESVETAAAVPVFGSVKKLSLENFPQRHLGLLPWHEHPASLSFVQEAALLAEKSVDLDRLLAAAGTAEPIDFAWDAGRDELAPKRDDSGLRIGVLRDSAFQFYYPENLEALGKTGARITEISAIEAKELPELDALYIGGGFPETHARRLAENLTFKKSLRTAVGKGLPVYAECGGLMYLSDNLQIDDARYPMSGVLPIETILKKQPQGHGYVQAEVSSPNPFYSEGTLLTGHEFHYSCVTGIDERRLSCVFRIVRGHGMDGTRDGISVRSVLATYLHVHALGTPQWAEGILKRAHEYHLSRSPGQLDRHQEPETWTIRKP